MHVAVDTLGHLLALLVTPANEPERAQVGELAKQVQVATQKSVELACVDQGYTGEQRAAAAAEQGIKTGSRQNWPKPNVGSCCCLDAGWSNAPSLLFEAIAPKLTTGSSNTSSCNVSISAPTIILLANFGHFHLIYTISQRRDREILARPNHLTKYY